MEDHTLNTQSAATISENTLAHVILYLDEDGIALSIDGPEETVNTLIEFLYATAGTNKTNE